MKLIILLLLSTFCFAKDIKVLEIDSGVGSEDHHGHGSHIAGIIMKDVCPEVKLISCKYFEITNTEKENFTNEMICFNKALVIKPDIINFSSGGPGPNKEEYEVLKKLSALNIKIIVAAGNNNEDLSESKYGYYPAKYNIKNLIPVGNLRQDGFKNHSSNYGLDNMVWEIGTNIISDGLYGYKVKMTGTSQSTAARSNRILKELCLKK